EHHYTVGLENATGTSALQVYTDGGCPPLRDNFAIHFTPILPPLGPTALVVNVSGTDLRLTWHAIPAHVFYEIYRSNTESFPETATEFIGATSDSYYVDTGGLLSDEMYFYRVIAN